MHIVRARAETDISQLDYLYNAAAAAFPASLELFHSISLRDKKVPIVPGPWAGPGPSMDLLSGGIIDAEVWESNVA